MTRDSQVPASPASTRAPRPDRAPKTAASFVERILLALLVLIPVVFSVWTEDTWDFPKSNLLIVGALALACWALTFELARIQDLGLGEWARRAMDRLGRTIRQDPLGGAMLLFVASSAVSTVSSPNPLLGLYGSKGSYAGLLVACASATIYFAARSRSGDVAFLSRVCAASAIAGAIASIYGVMQFLRLDPLIWGMVPYLRGLRRVAGTLGQPNVLGIFLAMTLPLVFWRGSRSGTWRGWIAWGSTALLSIVALGLTWSRASWVALAVSAMVAAGLMIVTRGTGSAARPRRVAALGAGVLLILIVAGVVFLRGPMGTHLLARVREISSFQENGVTSRFVNWGVGLRIGAKKPLLGAGTDQFGLEFTPYRTANYYRLEFGAIPLTAHNIAVHLFATQGGLGLLSGLLIFLFAGRAVWLALRHGDPAARGAITAIAMSLTGFLLWDLANYTVAAIGALAAVLAGWVSPIGNRELPRGSSPTAVGLQRRPLWARVVGILVFVIALHRFVLIPVLAQAARRGSMHEGMGVPRQITKLQRAESLAPWDGRYPHYLAYAYMTMAARVPDPARRQAILREAQAAEERAIRSEPRDALPHAGLGRALAQLAAAGAPDVHLTQIQGAFEDALARDPANAMILETYAEAMFSLEHLDLAHALALRALEVDPESAKLMSFIGLLALREGRLAAAADTLTLSLKRDWRGEGGLMAAALANLSGVDIELGRFEAAKTAAAAALSIQPSLEVAARNREVAIQHLGAPAATRK